MTPIKDGEISSTVYRLIRDHMYSETVDVLTNAFSEYRQTRPMLSLLGFCYYQMRDFVSAADCYEELTRLHPSVGQYKFYFAMALYKASLFDEAMNVSSQIESQDMETQITKLKMTIKFGQNDLTGAEMYLDQCPSSDHDVIVNHGCLLFKRGLYEEALRKFSSASQLSSDKSQSAYNIAVCHYMLKNYGEAVKLVAETVRSSLVEHPELTVRSCSMEADIQTFGDVETLRKTSLVEAFNLEMACSYMSRQISESNSALDRMPLRSENSVDPVTLHNKALLCINTRPTESLQRLQYLLQQESFPPETFPNLLLAFIKYDFYDMTADVLAENSDLVYRYLTPYQYDFLDAVITRQISPEESYRKLDKMISKLLESIKKATKKIEEGKRMVDEELAHKGLLEYEDSLTKYTAVLMQQAKIHWDMESYERAEKIFQSSYIICGDDDCWKLNLAHVLFMQGNKFQEAMNFYEAVVKKNYDNLLDVSAIVLANLCVSYAITGHMSEAEELIRKIEKEELQSFYHNPDRMTYHSCIVNLVIGTMYCTQGNYEFGIMRVIHSLQPYNKKLGVETWYYTKRCFLSLIECLAKHMILVNDSVLQKCVEFLEDCENNGYGVTSQGSPNTSDPIQSARHSVTYEARKLKALLLRIM